MSTATKLNPVDAQNLARSGRPYSSAVIFSGHTALCLGSGNSACFVSKTMTKNKYYMHWITSSLSGSFWSPQTHDMPLVFGILPPRWDCWRCLRFHFQYNLLIVVSQFPNGSPGGVSYLVGRRVSFGEQAHFIQMIYIYINIHIHTSYRYSDMEIARYVLSINRRIKGTKARSQVSSSAGRNQLRDHRTTIAQHQPCIAKGQCRSLRPRRWSSSSLEYHRNE